MKIKNLISYAGFFSLLLILNFCAPKINDSQTEKIKFDLSQLNEEGLTGENENLVAVDYEFCIPKSDSLKEIVLSIDSSVKFFAQSKGRIGCDKNEILCVGNSRQKNAKETLIKLAELDFVKKIERTFYE